MDLFYTSVSLQGGRIREEVSLKSIGDESRQKPRIFSGDRFQLRYHMQRSNTKDGNDTKHWKTTYEPTMDAIILLPNISGKHHVQT